MVYVYVCVYIYIYICHIYLASSIQMSGYSCPSVYTSKWMALGPFISWCWEKHYMALSFLLVAQLPLLDLRMGWCLEIEQVIWTFYWGEPPLAPCFSTFAFFSLYILSDNPWWLSVLLLGTPWCICAISRSPCGWSPLGCPSDLEVHFSICVFLASGG